MTKKTIHRSLGSALLVTFFSAQAVDFRSLAELRKSKITNNLNSILVVKESSGKCTVFGNAKTGTTTAGGFCKGSRLAKSVTNPQQAVSAKMLPASSLLSVQNSEITGPSGVKCTSVGGSKAGATGNTGAFCLAADINTLKTPAVKFSVANGLPVEGLQYLQVSFRDGSKLVGSRPIPSPNATIGSKCISAGKSSSGVTGKTGDFCLASDLFTSTTAPAQFAVANSVPVASLQIIQVTFRNSLFNNSSQNPIAGAKCSTVTGSTSVNEGTGGFCLAADLKAPTNDLASFVTTNKLPAAGLQFLQITFKDRYSLDSSGHLIDTPRGAECKSIRTSVASTGATGEFCIVSRLNTLATGFANFSMANDLPVERLQFLQAMFADDNSVDNAANSIKCQLPRGSSSTISNPNGFCLAADRRSSTSSYANFTVANNLPLTALQFIQIPYKNNGQAPSGPRQPIDAAAAIGVTLSDVINFPTQGLLLPDLARLAGRKQRYFAISEQTSEIALHSSPITQTDYHPVFWFSR